MTIDKRDVGLPLTMSLECIPCSALFASQKHRRSRSSSSAGLGSEGERDSHSELDHPLLTSQLRAWAHDTQGLVNDMTLLDQVQGRVCRLIAWEEERGMVR